MINPTQFEHILADLLPDDDRPVVVHSSLWPVARHFLVESAALPELIMRALLKRAGQNRTLLMPAFTSGFKDGILNLDLEPIISGVLSEMLRRTTGARRTMSAFFSFVCLGPDAPALESLRPRDAWGDGSLYEWMEKRDAYFLMIGTPKTQYSFLHRLEWLVRDKIPYRYIKEFSGKVRYLGKEETLRERLFVRDLHANIKNTWEYQVPLLEQNGMRSYPVGSSFITSVGARATINALLPVITRDPFAFLQNPEKVREYYCQSMRNKT